MAVSFISSFFKLNNKSIIHDQLIAAAILLLFSKQHPVVATEENYYPRETISHSIQNLTLPNL